jgi:hypothetical protein
VSALADLEQLRGDVGALEARVADLDRARHEGARRVQIARAALLDFHREREAGGLFDTGSGEAIVVEVDGVTEEELVAAVREAESGLSLRAVTRPYGGGMSDVDLEPVDEFAEARLAGAEQALQAAKARLRAFASAHLDGLMVERVPKAAAAMAALIDADRAYRLAAQGYQRELEVQTHLLRDADRQDLIAELPDHPGAWIAQTPTEVPLPLPVPYRP